MGRVAPLFAACAVLALTACGAGGAAAPGTTAHRHAKTCAKSALALAQIHRDVVALAKAAKLPTKSTLLGNHAINVATDRFLTDVQLAPISNLQRNRLTDLAMSAIGTHCQQCFQALEANRPIPAIRAGQIGCPT